MFVIFRTGGHCGDLPCLQKS